MRSEEGFLLFSLFFAILDAVALVDDGVHLRSDFRNDRRARSCIKMGEVDL